MFDDAYAIALISAAYFGTALVLTQFGLRWLAPLQGAAVSVPTTALFFLLVSPLTIDWSNWDARGSVVFALVGCLFPAAVTVLTFQANRRVGPNVAGAAGNLAPLFAVLFAIFLLGELPGARQWTGIAVIVLGVSLMTVSRDGGSGERWPLIALALPLAAALIRGMVQPAIRFGLAFWNSPFAAATIGYVVSAALILAVTAFRSRLPSPRGDQRGMAWFAGVGICNGMAVLTMYMALARGEVAVVAPLVATYPIATLLLSAIFLRNLRLAWTVILGVGVTVTGVATLLAG